ncbi:hypothetical protein K2P47_01075 [Patescibacteria group bacterium]|nr:hypothetical protein [Patescibacteria group bacterium]
MPLDFTSIDRAFDENPDPEKLKKMLEEIMAYFLEDIAPYVDENNKIQAGVQSANPLDSPLFTVVMKIQGIEQIFEEIGWPEAFKEMKADFIYSLYKTVGLDRPECWE